MQPEERDIGKLADMVEFAREVVDLTAGITFERFADNRALRLAIERCLELVGEAASRISNTFRDAHPEVPWSSIIGLRIILAHEYGKVDYRRLWLIAIERVPPLINVIQPLLPPPPSDPR